ncbi:MAG: hypothetical protein EPO21_06605 [Chloroflexota bacterium]|nr:MAG: hypothetical protein EPO21_06605 [Chloroflexota bacterium]
MTKERERSRTVPPEKRSADGSKYARSRKQHKSGLPSWIYVAAVAAVVVLLGGGAMALLGQGGGASTAGNAGTGTDVASGVQLPRYAYADPVALEGYKWATTQEGQDVLKYMPCYCGCGDHATHKNNLNCFIQDPVAGKPVVFDSHAST